jgi:hypothetical protein
MLKPIKGHPGRFLDTSSGQVLNIAEYREDDKYDTVLLPVGAQEATIEFGTQFVFFRDIMQKRPIDTNFTQPVRLSAGEQMIVDRVGLWIRDSMGTEESVSAQDKAIIAACGFLRVEVNQKLLIEGPGIKFPSGYGLSGMDIYGLTVGIGVPSTAAAAKLVKTQTLTSRHEVIGYLTFYNRDWMLAEPGVDLTQITPPELTSLEPGVPVTCFLHGLIKSAVSK